MKKDKIYSNIDMKQTGKALRQRVKEKGYSVREIQKMLMLSCPQPVYRWFNGQVLPSVNHLYVLSQILECHMEELLVEERGTYIYEIAGTENGIIAEGRRWLRMYGRTMWQSVWERVLLDNISKCLCG